MKEIVLASASPRRVELLKQIGLTFKICPSNVDENIDEPLEAHEFAGDLSFKKAMHVAKSLEGEALVIGADTVVAGDSILGKPLDEKHAFEMIRSLEGKWHEVITGITVVDSATLKYTKTYEVTRVKMRELNEDSIYAYLKTGEYTDKAGAYAIQGIGALLVEKIDGCYFNVVGLPLVKLAGVLEEFGAKVL